MLSNEEYLERYHSYLRQLVDEYVNGGRFNEVYSRIRSQIDSLVETDPTAFYNYDEYQTAAGLLYETVKLRAESIEGQLDGVIPSTDAAQRKDSSSFVDASHIDVETMGKFSMGGGGFGGFGGRSGEDSGDASDGSSSEVVNTVHRGGRGKNSRGFGGQGGGFSGNRSSSGTSSSSANSAPSGNSEATGRSAANANNTASGDINSQPFPSGGSFSDQSGGFPSGFGGMMSEEGGERPSFSGMPGQFSGSSQSTQQTLIMYGVLLMVMIALLLVLRKIRRH